MAAEKAEQERIAFERVEQEQQVALSKQMHDAMSMVELPDGGGLDGCREYYNISVRDCVAQTEPCRFRKPRRSRDQRFLGIGGLPFGGCGNNRCPYSTSVA